MTPDTPFSAHRLLLAARHRAVALAEPESEEEREEREQAEAERKDGGDE